MGWHCTGCRRCSRLANVRSLRFKVDELQAVANLNLPGIICITENWLDSDVADSAISLDGFCCFRSDRIDGYGSVCTYVTSHIPCKRLVDFESSDVESLWLTIWPFRLPRAVSLILLGVVYHPPRNGPNDNKILLKHIQNNVDSFLCKHPEGVVVVWGDFNPISTGISEQQI